MYLNKEWISYRDTIDGTLKGGSEIGPEKNI